VGSEYERIFMAAARMLWPVLGEPEGWPVFTFTDGAHWEFDGHTIRLESHAKTDYDEREDGDVTEVILTLTLVIAGAIRRVITRAARSPQQAERLMRQMCVVLCRRLQRGAFERQYVASLLGRVS